MAKDMLAIVEAYLAIFPEERPKLELLVSQLAAQETMNDRTNFRGHITGAAIVVSPDKQKLLMIHHKNFKRWLHPGGHWDPGEASPWDAAAREAVEETSVKLAKQLTNDQLGTEIPVLISSHPIPERPDKQEPAHVHHDFRYVFLASSEKLAPQLSEVSDARWVPFAELTTEPGSINLARARYFGLI